MWQRCILGCLCVCVFSKVGIVMHKKNTKQKNVKIFRKHLISGLLLACFCNFLWLSNITKCMNTQNTFRKKMYFITLYFKY